MTNGINYTHYDRQHKKETIYIHTHVHMLFFIFRHVLVLDKFILKQQVQ